MCHLCSSLMNGSAGSNTLLGCLFFILGFGFALPNWFCCTALLIRCSCKLLAVAIQEKLVFFAKGLKLKAEHTSTLKILSWLCWKAIVYKKLNFLATQEHCIYCTSANLASKVPAGQTLCPSGKLEEGSGCVSPVTSARCSQVADISAELGHNLNQLAISLLYQQQCPYLQYVCRYMRSSTDCHFVIQKMDLMAWSHVTQLSSSS